ncbi:sensor histidine kinase [Flavobacterium rivuli]|uniref:sensor histidine kinase n=1 Tax=Flavobacterium rivuli TaxID=498301 RepID=UPI00036BDCD0|nr:ATP-binding protein [Flavobacterium rivuli]
MMVTTAYKYNFPIILTGIFVIFIAVTVMTGWLLHLDAIQSLLPGHISMHFNSAICFILLSVALLLYVKYRNRGGHRLTGVLSLIVFLVGATTFSQKILHSDLGIDYLFFKNHNNPYYPGKMSPLTALCLAIMSISTFGISLNTNKYKTVCQFLFHFVSVVAFIVLIGYLYNVPSLYNLSYYTTMACHTAVALLLLSIAASLINPSLGITGIFTGKRMGNVMARRLFSQIVVAVLIIGYLRILSHRYHWLSADVGIAFLIVSFILVSLFLIWKKANILNKLEVNMEIAQENFRIGVESAPYALILSDETGRITQVNFQTEKLYGYTSEELIGKNIEMLIPKELHKHYRHDSESFFTSPAVVSLGIDDEVYANTKNGAWFPVEIVLTPITTQNGISVLASVTDVTSRKANEAIIKNQVKELQLKNQELEHFNYIASHDLQEPLRTVSNYIMLLEEDYPEQINDEIRMHLSTMNSAVSRMSQLVRSLLDFGRLGKNRKLSLTDCCSIITNVKADLNGLIKQTNAVITIVDDMPVLYAYETEMRQLFQNLINNAIKFTDKDTAPQINIGCKKTKGFYEFYVSDNGIGIDPKHFNDIFHIFQRLNKNEDYEGYGIGLANCRKIAEMHGGEIWVESELGKGSTFKFKILNFKA